MKERSWLTLIFGIAAAASLITGIRLGRTYQPEISDNPLLLSGLRSPATPMNSALGMILAKTPEDLEKVDVTTLYLACMSGLPGTEHVDLDQARRHIEDLAKQVKAQTEATARYQSSVSKNFKDSPESKALALVELLREYEQNAARMPQQLPENLFLRNHVGPLNESRYYNPLQAAMAGRLQDFRLAEPGAAEDAGQTLPLNNPLLLVAVGQQLGYPVTLVKGPDHLFVRWDDGTTTHFNIDELGKYGLITSYPIRPDSDYERLSGADEKEGGLFKAMSHADIAALFLQAREKAVRGEQRGFDAELAAAAAHRFAPATDIYREDLILLVGEEMKIRDMHWKDMTEHNGSYFNLSPPEPDRTIIP